ncbi:uncharacterized protein LOC132750744 [Ruditapes philippinarum]|uniref:uncharacterized protein LOC132750744 n=1 Tax=Ruditapes philippinarum TaxID=129788 RepID=UPI00295A9108|nr:uncharacterized protein LOC132750744 [Ruditapes philippinarum]
MADTRVSGDISVDVMIQTFDCKHTGSLSTEGTGMLFWRKWISKYFIISKGGKEGCVWNFYCYDTEFARKQEWSISMREVERHECWASGHLAGIFSYQSYI